MAVTEVDQRRCDVCGDAIAHERHVRLKRTLLGRVHLRLYHWGIIDTAPVDSGWLTSRADICRGCWDGVLDEVATRIEDVDSGTGDGRTVRMEGRGVIDPDDLSWQPATKRPVTVEATPMPAPFEVETLEGTMEGGEGDVLIRGVEGELYPCDSDIFAETYDVENGGGA